MLIKKSLIVAKLTLQVALMVFPWSIRRVALKVLFGYRINRRARIGMSLLDVQVCRMAPNSRIGHFNMIRNLGLLELAEDAGIGTFNKIIGYPENLKASFSHVRNRRCHLSMGAMSGLTSRHHVDCTAGVTIGRRTTIAGIRSTILTHSIDVRENRQDAAPVEFGEGCFVGTNVIVLPGVKIPDHCVVGAGSVVNRSLPSSGAVYGGNPASERRSLHVDQVKYFHRSKGNVD